MSAASTTPATPTGPRSAFLDCTVGVAGDMLLGALLDAGSDVGAVREAIAALGVPGLALAVRPVRRAGLRCTQAVIDTLVGDQPARGLSDVLAVIETARLSAAAAALAQRAFWLLARAEAAVHGVTLDRVHFHEVGAADALADVVGTAVAAEQLGLLDGDAVVACSALAAGSGTTRSAHGTLPVPAPAVLELVAQHGLALTGATLTGERTTPTGAALVAALVTPGPGGTGSGGTGTGPVSMPTMVVEAVGTGAGSRDFPTEPNITRVVIGTRITTIPAAAGRTDQCPDGPIGGEVMVVEATVDDLDPQLWPAVLAAVRAAGAWDCWTTATVGRQGRPGQVLTALCAEALRPAVVDTLLRHTTTLGVRWACWQRRTLPRTSVLVRVGPPGAEQDVTVKVTLRPDGEHTAKPEILDIELAAEKLGWSPRRVSEVALSAYHQTYPNGQLAGWLA